MEKTKRKLTKVHIIIIGSVSVALVAGLIIGLVLGLRETPRTTQEWLNEFRNAIDNFNLVNEDGSNLERRFERRIEIFDNDELIVQFHQSVEVAYQDEKLVARLKVTEEYPTLNTNEFNIRDEFYLIDSRMFALRVDGDSQQITHFESSMEIFFELVDNNIGGQGYEFNENNFDTLYITHSDNAHNMTANIAQERLSYFFIGNSNAVQFSDVSLEIFITDDLNLKSFTLRYTDSNGRNVIIQIRTLEPREMILGDWVQNFFNS